MPDEEVTLSLRKSTYEIIMIELEGALHPRVEYNKDVSKMQDDVIEIQRCALLEIVKQLKPLDIFNEFFSVKEFDNHGN